MAWTVLFLDERVETEMERQPVDIRARFDQIPQLIRNHGPKSLPPKYASCIGDNAVGTAHER